MNLQSLKFDNLSIFLGVKEREKTSIEIFFLHRYYPWFNPNESLSVTQVLEGHYRIPVFCCWNALAILNTSPFYDYEYRWRFGQEDLANGDCASGEMGYLCEDLWALYGNQTRIYINPSVHVAYKWETYRAIEETDWFKQSLVKQAEFQTQVRKHSILDPLEIVHVPQQWQCVSVEDAPQRPFHYSWKYVRMLTEYQKIFFIRKALAYKDDWRQARVRESNYETY